MIEQRSIRERMTQWSAEEAEKHHQQQMKEHRQKQTKEHRQQQAKKQSQQQAREQQDKIGVRLRGTDGNPNQELQRSCSWSLTHQINRVRSIVCRRSGGSHRERSRLWKSETVTSQADWARWSVFRQERNDKRWEWSSWSSSWALESDHSRKRSDKMAKIGKIKTHAYELMDQAKIKIHAFELTDQADIKIHSYELIGLANRDKIKIRTYELIDRAKDGKMKTHAGRLMDHQIGTVRDDGSLQESTKESSCGGAAHRGRKRNSCIADCAFWVGAGDTWARAHSFPVMTYFMRQGQSTIITTQTNQTRCGG